MLSYAAGTILGTGDISRSKIDKSACPHRAYILEGLSKWTDPEHGKEKNPGWHQDLGPGGQT